VCYTPATVVDVSNRIPHIEASVLTFKPVVDHQSYVIQYHSFLFLLLSACNLFNFNVLCQTA